MEQSDNAKDFLQDLEASFIERRAARYVKKVKTGRAQLFIIALFNLVTIARGVEVYEQNSMKIKMAAAVAIFYFVLFVWSMQKAYISLVIGTITYLLLGVYTTISEQYMYKYMFNDEILGMQRMIFIIVIIVRLMIFYFLVLGTINAKKFEALYVHAHDNDDGEDDEE